MSLLLSNANEPAMTSIRSFAFLLLMWSLGPGPALMAPVPAAAQAPVMVSAEWVAARQSDDQVVLAQVAMVQRAVPEEFIPGSVLLDYQIFADERDGLSTQIQPLEDMVRTLEEAGISSESHVVLYGSPLLAARLFMTLEVLGHVGRVSYLDGGLAAWKAEGGDVTDAPTQPSSGGDFTPAVQDDIVVSADWVLANLDNDAVTLLDARPLDEYTGERTPGDLRPGHIPGAYNLYWEDFIESRDNPILEALDDARARLAASGVGADDTLVSYCYIGMRASYNYMVARHLGYQVRFYDGSWDEWAKKDGFPAVEGSSRR